MNKTILKYAQLVPDEKVIQKAKELGIPEEMVKTNLEPKKEIGVPYVTDLNQVKFVIDRNKAPKYSPFGIILPAEESKGKVVDLNERRVIEGEGTVPEEFYTEVKELIDGINKLMGEIENLKETTTRLREEYSRIIQPYVNEVKVKETELHRRILDLFWHLYNAGVKAVKAGDIFYTLKAQLERTGKVNREKLREVLQILAKVIYKSHGILLDVNTVLQSAMGKKLVVELNRLGDIANVLKQTIMEPTIPTTPPTSTTAPTTPPVQNVPGAAVNRPTPETISTPPQPQKTSSINVSEEDFEFQKEIVLKDLNEAESLIKSASVFFDNLILSAEAITTYIKG
jgi:FtsZ-binding cell division protein ZapB